MLTRFINRKKIIQNSLVLVLFSFFTSHLSAQELVFILAGQSNMSGQGNSVELPPSYQRVPSNIEFYYNGYKAPLNRFRHFGPEIGFAHEIARHFPHTKIKLIKFAVGGTSLFAWDPQWTASKARLTRNASAGPLFKKLIKTIKIQFNEETSKLAGVLWMQGEADAKYPNAAKQYANNLNRFVNALRVELKSPNTPFIMGSIHPPINLFPATPVVQQAQKTAASRIRNLRLINTADLTKRNDHLHYNTDGQLELGKRFAKAFVSTRMAVVQPR
jgi:hypothetical protein